MAEVGNPASAADWSFPDRNGFTRRWTIANIVNLMRGASGAGEYGSISQRTAFYNWFDQIREIQGHEILWPGAAWIVASQMRSLDDPLRTAAISLNEKFRIKHRDSRSSGEIVDKLIRFGNAGNKAIFDDVFPKLAEVHRKGLRGEKIKGDDATKWDEDTLRHEQFDVVDPIYQSFTNGDPILVDLLYDMASGSDIYVMGGVAIGGQLDFKGDILSAQDRYNHGLNVVGKFYGTFKQVIDSARSRRQIARPDPSGWGMVRAG